MAYSSLLIIGNGFDKNSGLKTSYQDVYKEYLKSESDSEVICNFKHNISSNFKNWSDFEIGMAVYAKELNNENELMECVNDFNHFMRNYLIGVQADFHDKYNSIKNKSFIIDEMSKSISSLGTGITHNLDNRLHDQQAQYIFNLGIISFNYTDTFDYIFHEAYSRFKHNDVIHIHGVLSDDTVLGVDDEKQLIVPYPISDKSRRCFIKPFFNVLYDSTRVSSAKVLLEDANSIFIYGASLGDSDLSWRTELVSWLSSDSDHHLFYYRNTYSSMTYKTVQERLNLEEDEKYKLFKKWNVVNFEPIFNQVHLCIGTNIFNFEKALNKELMVDKVIDKISDKTISDLRL